MSVSSHQPEQDAGDLCRHHADPPHDVGIAIGGRWLFITVVIGRLGLNDWWFHGRYHHGVTFATARVCCCAQRRMFAIEQNGGRASQIFRCMYRLRCICTHVTLAAVAALIFTTPAFAQTTGTYRDARRLGGSTSFHKPPLTNAASVKRMADARGMAADIRRVLADSGISETADAVLATMASQKSLNTGGLCTDAAPADGVLVECDFQPGATLEWMAYRPNINTGDRSPGRIERFRWAGRSAFKAFLFRVTNNNRIYTFVLPKPCGNLSLMSVTEIRTEAPPAPAPPAPRPPAPPPPVVAPPPPAPPPPTQPPPAVQPPPPPPDVDGGSLFFVDALFGKDRRVRPIAGRTTGNGLPVVGNAGIGNDSFAQCSPIVGLKAGLAKRFANDWEIAASGGVALSLVSADDKVNEHQWLIDVEANKYLNNGMFVGTGLSLWDITHSDTFTPAWLLQFGAPLGDKPVYFLVQSRLFLKEIDDVRNNYQIWGGVRVHF